MFSSGSTQFGDGLVDTHYFTGSMYVSGSWNINGYSINEAETFNYVYGVGAPIMDSQNRAIAAIAISGTKGSINVKTVEGLAKKVTETAKMISLKLKSN